MYEKSIKKLHQEIELTKVDEEQRQRGIVKVTSLLICCQGDQSSYLLSVLICCQGNQSAYLLSVFKVSSLLICFQGNQSSYLFLLSR